MTVTLQYRTQAEHLRPRSQTITATDAWGHEHRWLVTWLPAIFDGADAAADNIGKVWVAWSDEPPVRVVRLNGDVSLRPAIARVAASFEQVIEATEVHSLNHVEPGCFYVG